MRLSTTKSQTGQKKIILRLLGVEPGPPTWLANDKKERHLRALFLDGGYGSWMKGIVLGWRAWFLDVGDGSWIESMVLKKTKNSDGGNGSWMESIVLG